MKDVHIHIERGPYTKEWIDTFVKQAVEMGLDEIYLLEHSHRFQEFSPMYAGIRSYSEYQNSWYEKRTGCTIKQYTDLIAEMRQYTFPIQIKWGLEVCYFPDYENLISDFITSFPFDFATGSIHWVNGFDFDHRAEFWKDINVELLYNQYYDSMLALVNSGLFTGLAHPDSIKCFHFFPAGDLTPKYRLLADALNRHHMNAEQSGGLALNYGFPEMGMNLSMLDIFKRENVQIQFASDAHRPEDVGKNISEMRSALYQ